MSRTAGHARTAVDVTGEGPLVLCLPGMGDLRSVYRFLSPALVAAEDPAKVSGLVLIGPFVGDRKNNPLLALAPARIVMGERDQDWPDPAVVEFANRVSARA